MARSGWADDGLDVAKAMIVVDRIVVCVATSVVAADIGATIASCVVANTAVDADLYQTVFSEELGEIFLFGLGN